MATSGSESRPPGQLGRLAHVLFSVSAIAAVLYFLGRARIQAMLVTLGVPAGKVHLPPFDYMSASIDVVVPLFVALAVLALGLIAVHQTVVLKALALPRYRLANKIVHTVLNGLAAVGALGLCLAATATMDQETIGRRLGIALPIILTSSAIAIWYRIRTLPIGGRTADRASTALLVSLSVGGLLWTSSLYGTLVGTKFAEHFVENSADQADVMIISRDDLKIHGPGISVQRWQPPNDDSYRYCYRGLRYLMENSKYYIFAPLELRPGIDPLYLIPTKKDLRFDTERAALDATSQADCSDR